MDPGNQQSPEQQSAERQLADRSPANSRPSNASGTTQPQTQPGLEPLAEGTAPKKRKHHGHRRRRHRRQSFAPPPDTPRPDSDTGRAGVSPGRGDGSQSTSTTAIQHRASVYRLGQLGRNNPSETSLDSDALLDHRYGRGASLVLLHFYDLRISILQRHNDMRKQETNHDVGN